MSKPQVEKIANAVLYEGYILYPYRSSAVKNRQRFNFGVIYPREYSAAQNGVDICRMETQCLALGDPQTSLSIKVRCLRLVERVAGLLPEPMAELPPDGELKFTPAASIEINGRTFESWQEAAECEISLPVLTFAELQAAPVQQKFTHPATRTVELLRDGRGLLTGVIERTRKPLECVVDAGIEHLHDGLFRIGIQISNTTSLSGAPAGREAVLAQSLLSAHTILRVQGGEFVSLLEPPPLFQEEAAGCRNLGTWPVLAGGEGARDTMLSSPIILYDYPQVAPESPGDLFDGAEIDEILSLRILALTDDEKEAMRRSDERARLILERTEMLPPEHFMKLHGALRTLHPAGKEAS